MSNLSKFSEQIKKKAQEIFLELESIAFLIENFQNNEHKKAIILRHLTMAF